jgi:hypothetical protein
LELSILVRVQVPEPTFLKEKTGMHVFLSWGSVD